MDPIRLLEERQALLLGALGDLCNHLSIHLPQSNASEVLNSLFIQEKEITKKLFEKELPYLSHSNKQTMDGLRLMQAMLKQYHADKLIDWGSPRYKGVSLSLEYKNDLTDIGVSEVYLPVTYNSGVDVYSPGTNLYFEVYVTPREKRIIEIPFERVQFNPHELDKRYREITGDKLFPEDSTIAACWAEVIDLKKTYGDDIDKSCFPRYVPQQTHFDVSVVVPSFLVTPKDSLSTINCSFKVSLDTPNEITSYPTDPLERLKLLESLKHILAMVVDVD